MAFRLSRIPAIRRAVHSVDYMVSEVRVVERAVLVIIISRCLERIGDHATNICEASIFIAKGVDIKHHGA